MLWAVLILACLPWSLKVTSGVWIQSRIVVEPLGYRQADWVHIPTCHPRTCDFRNVHTSLLFAPHHESCALNVIDDATGPEGHPCEFQGWQSGSHCLSSAGY